MPIILVSLRALIVTPRWTSICNPINSEEVSRNAGFCTDLCKNFLGEDPHTPLSIHLSQVKYFLHNLHIICILPWRTYTYYFINHLRNPPPPPFFFLFLSSNIPSSPAYGVFISQLIRYSRACSSYECFILRARRLSSKLLKQGYLAERLKSSFRKFYGRYGDLIQQYEVSLSRMLNDILILDQQWLPNQSDFPPISWPWYRAWPSPIMSGFHGAFATGVACQQGTLTTPDTWFRPLFDGGLHVLWLLRPVSPNLHRLNDLPMLTFTELRGFHGAFATGVACQQGALTLPDTWFRPPFWDLLMLQLLRPNSSNLPCLYSTFHLEYPLVLSRFCFAFHLKICAPPLFVNELRHWQYIYNLIYITSTTVWCILAPSETS